MYYIAVIFSILFLIFMLLFSMDDKQQYKYINYKVTSCSQFSSGRGFWFVTPDNKSTRHFTLNSKMNRMFIGFPGGKGNIKWSVVKKISYIKISEQEGYVSLEFNKPVSFLSFKRYEKIEFGVMSVDCWKTLRDLVQDGINTSFIE